MLTCTGKSLVPINIFALQQFLGSVIPKGKLEDFEIHLDARGRVKSVFAKLEGNCLTIYTGAIVGLGSQKFSEISDSVSLLMLFAIYGIKKAGLAEDFEIKSTDQGIAEIKTDANFQMLSGNLNLFMDRFSVINAQAIQTQVESVPAAVPEPSDKPSVTSEPVVTEAPKKTTRSSSESPYKGVPLENTPKIDVPDGLDLRAV